MVSERKKGRSHDAVGHNLGGVCSKKEEQDPRHQNDLLALLDRQLTQSSMTERSSHLHGPFVKVTHQTDHHPERQDQ